MNESLTHWIPDNVIKNCANCMTSFGLLTRKSHCRQCGKIFCKNSSNYSDLEERKRI